VRFTSYDDDDATPVPVRLIVDVVPVDELLVMVTVPLEEPGVWGSNSISSVAVAPEFNVTGNVTPEIE